MAVLMTIEEVGIDPKEWAKRSTTEGLKSGLQAVGFAWHAKYLPQHFARGAAGKYGYAQRSLGYLRRKQRKGNLPPLVWGGELQRRAMAMGAVSVRAGKMIVKMTVPGYIDMKRRDQAAMDRLAAAAKVRPGTKATPYPDVKRELTSTTDGEIRELRDEAFSPAVMAYLAEKGVRPRRRKLA
jgi:hypothetical protein